MPATLSQYRGAVGGFISQFVPSKQYNFFYSDSFRKLNMPVLSSLLTNIHVCVYEVISFKLCTVYVVIKKEYSKYQLLCKQRSLYTLILATYILRHIWFRSILITLSCDIEKSLGPKPSPCDKFSICDWNLNSISVQNFIKISITCVCFNP